MAEPIHIYYDHLPSLSESLARDGCLSMILLDISTFSAIEEQWGAQTCALVRERLFALLKEQSGIDYRKEDVLALEEPAGLRILLFLSPRRKEGGFSYEHLETLRIRLIRTLIPKLSRTALPYLKGAPHISVGYALGAHNPLVSAQHTVLCLIREALDRARWVHWTEEMESLQRLRETILNEQVITLYQPIVDLQEGKPIGYEALSRGGFGVPYQSANDLFSAAIRHHLLVELDRICRKRALAQSGSLPGKTKVFLNTLPAAMHDPEFQGQCLADSLDRARITPDRIVIEITERLVLDNLTVFQDAISRLTDQGMSLAVEDLGSGYSGLETIGRLKPRYLKVDMGLVRDIHNSMIHREVLKAILQLGQGIGADVIAEGIEKPEELDSLRALGFRYCQGFLLGMPELIANLAPSGSLRT